MGRKVIIIGAGHNGLVCAWYLARAGYRVEMLETRSIVGGAAVTETFHPGFRNSTASYTVGLLDPGIIADMKLHDHGLRIVERPIDNFLPLGEDGYLILGGGRSHAEVAKFSVRDAERLPEYRQRLSAAAALLRYLADVIPPNAGGGIADLFRALGQGRAALKLPLDAQRDAIDLFTRSAREFLGGFFESEPVKAAFGFDSIVGAYHSPDTPGSAYVLLHHVFNEVNGKDGKWGHAIGGMGAITQAMARACEALGINIRTDETVAKVLADSGHADGVETANGERIRGDIVIGNVHPKRLLLDLVEPGLLDPALRARMEQHASGSGTFRMNVALKELPRFACLPEPGPHLSSGIIIAPSLDYMDAAYQEARTRGWSKAPVIEMLIPSTMDDTLAPPGAHVASLFCQHFDPTLDWDRHREAAADTILDTVEAHAPGFRSSILGQMALSPLDLERRFGLVGGDIFHGRMSLDQLWAMRPMLGLADHRMPVPGLYLCGAGAHPGGGVTGRPGRNAAQAVIKDGRRFFRTAARA
ncbi:phytoene desaturase family protein [Parasphingopyxis marina]|uniref:Pyridine nucleotide-disulfide oxidoreductase domain-containing protein 2 n=1 Tax=Parasphingopyxis marina TaxID=2761622 RepID=A0A842HWE7_9SPHN|nr:NAD(P)/FAD-dependent oxidoreductase [Parasphingopyxis marina]MBC2776681.1 NAD(P)/FAD-dependent oxidoreductase [Parasphingopyxis marina]